jgi:hypothetical protein
VNWAFATVVAVVALVLVMFLYPHPHPSPTADIMTLSRTIYRPHIGQVRAAAPEIDLATSPLSGVLYFGGGYLLSSLVLTAILVNVIDRAFSRAALWSAIASLL